MANLTRIDTDDIELDIQFGQEPLGLAHFVQDKAMIVTGTVVLTWLGWITGGPILGVLALYVGANDLKFKQPQRTNTPWFQLTDEDDDFEGETLDTDAQAVIDADTESEGQKLGSRLQELQAKQPDNWVDDAIELGEASLPKQTEWPPATPAAINSRLDIMAHQEAVDMLADGPQAILDMLGDNAPSWVRDAAGDTRGHAPETLVQQRFEPVQRDGSEIGSGSGSVHGSECERALQQAAENGPYVVPVVGSKGKCYSFVRTAISLNKSQTWICSNIFGASKGGSLTYQNAVSYIKWVKGDD